jgi:hypothetical protein
MILKKVQKLEMIWVVLGFVFNTFSYWQIQIGNASLSTTEPIAGNVFMVICGIVVVLGLKGFDKTYKYVMPFLTISLAYSGWWLHINAYLLDSKVLGYATFVSWLAVVFINSYGLAMMAWGAWLAWSKPARKF